MPNDSKLIEAIILACIDSEPITFRPSDQDDGQRVKAAVKRSAMPKGATFRYTVNWNPFLYVCLDLTRTLPEEHLIIRYRYRYGQTTKVERVHHVAGEKRRVSIPPNM
jgi:hypothetical protein